MLRAQSKQTVSPRELGLALGVSESSVKRWIDAGRLPAKVTSGGHRRIELLPALRFIQRSSQVLLADPEVLGVSDPFSGSLSDPGALEGRVFEHLTRGRQDELERDLLAVLTIGALEPAELFDGSVCSAMKRIGDLWQGDHRGIYVEHRATQVLLRALDQVLALYEPPDDGPTAVGGSIAGDPGLIPSRMAATVLCHQGYRAVDLGASTPSEALLEAACSLGARLVWLSVSHVADARRQSLEVERLITRLAERDTACILGGREIGRLELVADGRARVGRTMRDLARLGARVIREGRA